MWMRVIDGHFAGEWVNVPEPYRPVIIPEFDRRTEWADDAGDLSFSLVGEHRYTPRRFWHHSWRCQECGKPIVLWYLTQLPGALLASPWVPDGIAVSLEIGEELDAQQKLKLAERHMDRYASRTWMEATGWVSRDA